MAYSTLRAAIQAAIKQNDNEEITGNLLQSVLLSIVNTVGAGYNFAGVATPSTNPGTPDGAMFWIGGKGTYANFGSSVTIAAGYLGIFMWDGSAFTRSVLKLSGGEGVFDVTDYTGNEYANLSAALAAIPQEAKAGGMQIRFVLSSDHKYVQYRYMGTSISNGVFNNIENWQGEDDEPISGSSNFVKSGGIANIPTDTLPTSLYEEEYVQGIKFELGNITITQDWSYSASNSRVRTPEGYLLHLYPGDKIGLSTYDNTRFYVGGHYLDGTSLAAGWLTADYTVLKEGYFCVLICNQTEVAQSSAQALGSIVQIHRKTTTQSRLNFIKNTQDGIDVITENELTLYEDNKYIDYLGALQSNSGYKVFSILAKKGDYVHVYTYASSGVSVLAKNGSGNFFDSIMCGIEGNDYHYIIQSDCTLYISVSKSSSYPYKILLIRNAQYDALTSIDEPSYISLTDFLEKKQGYVKYTDGSFNTTYSPIYVSMLKTDGIKRIKVFVSAGDAIPAAIAFYSTNEVSTSSFISAVRLVGNKGGGRWFSADVPNNAVMAAITNHYSYCPNPYICVDQIKRDVVMDSSIFGIGIVNGYRRADNYDGTFNPANTLNSYYPEEHFQEVIRNTPLYGIRVNIKSAGTLSVCKATGVLTNNCINTVIKTFNTWKTGWQVLLFDAPVIIDDTESLGIGINTDTARLVVDSVYNAQGGIRTNYLRTTSNAWEVYQQNMLIDVLGIPRADGTQALIETEDIKKKIAFAGENPFRFNGPFYAHLFLDKIYQSSTGITVPSESLDDVRISKRLGFDVIEANVQTTSDGKFIVIHGDNGKFGYEVTDLNGDFTYADTLINTVTLDWIKANIRYRSDIARFRTTVPTLEEFLRECRLQGMIPFAQASNASMVALLDSIMGYGNYFAYNGIRTLTSAPIVQYLGLATKAAIMEQARSIGVPYVYCMSNAASFTDEELVDIVNSLHSEGFMIASAYVGGASACRLRRLGFDMIASTVNVNNFDNANLCTLNVGVDWNDFQINGSTATDNGVELEGTSQTITPKTALSTHFLAKGVLEVTFNGTLYLTCGRDEGQVTSDGVHTVIFSSYFINEIPTFEIKGQEGGAIITDVVFKVSKC